MINKVILLGNLGADPEIKITSTDTKFARLNLATNERFKTKDGEVKEKTQWHNIVVFDPMVSDDKPQASTTEAPKQKLDTGQDIPF